uniref:Uncharacterized protein n=1 Tax=Caenorhabditis japonica TaxID=281687 RepID=A0A8R1DK75_CAEJA
MWQFRQFSNSDFEISAIAISKCCKFANEIYTIFTLQLFQRPHEIARPIPTTESPFAQHLTAKPITSLAIPQTSTVASSIGSHIIHHPQPSVPIAQPSPSVAVQTAAPPPAPAPQTVVVTTSSTTKSISDVSSASDDDDRAALRQIDPCRLPPPRDSKHKTLIDWRAEGKLIVQPIITGKKLVIGENGIKSVREYTGGPCRNLVYEPLSDDDE